MGLAGACGGCAGRVWGGGSTLRRGGCVRGSEGTCLGRWACACWGALPTREMACGCPCVDGSERRDAVQIHRARHMDVQCGMTEHRW